MQLVRISSKRIKQLGMFPLAEQAMAIRANDPFYQDGRMRTFFQVLVHDGVILGVVGWEYNSEKLFLGPLEVVPKYRGIGVGSLIVNLSILAAMSNKTKGVFLYCKNEFVDYYKKLGFLRVYLKWDSEESNEMIYPFYWHRRSDKDRMMGELYGKHANYVRKILRGMMDARKTA